MADDQLSTGFSDPAYALRLRDAVRQLAVNEFDGLNASSQIGRCMWVDLGKFKASVWFPGDPQPIEVNLFPDLVPNDVGDGRVVPGDSPTSSVGPGAIVLVEEINHKQYITRILSGGSFAFKQAMGGLSHSMFNTTHTTPINWDARIPVSQTYGNEFSFYLPSQSPGTDAILVGPILGLTGNSSLAGHIKLIISQFSEGRIYEVAFEDFWASVSPFQGGVDNERWMRLLPKQASHWIGNTDIDWNVDIGVKRTGILDKDTGLEFWFRISAYKASDYTDFFWGHIESTGLITKFGDPDTGRLLVIDQSPMTPVSGIYGFHNAQSGSTGGCGPRILEHEAAYTANTPFYRETSESDGPWRQSHLRTAKDLLPLWGCTGAFTWDGSGIGWTGNITLSGVGPNRYGLTDGLLEVPMPANGTRVPYWPGEFLGNITNAACTTLIASGKIPMAAGQTLYLIVPPGRSNGNLVVPGVSDFTPLKYLFAIVDSATYDSEEHNFNLPEWCIPIFHYAENASELQRARLTSHAVELIDSTQFSQVSATSAFSFTVTTESIVATLPSMTFKNGCAYRVKARWHLQSSSAATHTVVSRLRKGTTTAGAEWTLFGNAAINATNGAYGQYQEAYLANNSGADITTATIFTGTANSPTGISLPANATSQKRWIEIEYAGPAAKYPHAMSIT